MHIFKVHTYNTKYIHFVCQKISKAWRLRDSSIIGFISYTIITLTSLSVSSGQCLHCKDTLDRLLLSDKEFIQLQQNIKEKLLVGSDLFLKSSPDELKKFSNFVERTAPYDVVIDSLNVAYAVGKGTPANKLSMLFAVVDYFKERNKKILLLGRKHMFKWGKGSMERLTTNTNSFFTDNL